MRYFLDVSSTTLVSINGILVACDPFIISFKLLSLNILVKNHELYKNHKYHVELKNFGSISV
jgi:hypothetical protein